MRILLTLLLLAHGAIHLLGFVKAYGLAEVRQLRAPIGPSAGVLWLAAAVLLVGSAVAVWVAPRFWWLPALLGVVLSQALIVSAWGDARFGTIANVILLVPILLGAADLRPGSLRSRYGRAARDAVESAPTAPPEITARDLAGLPPQVRTYLERVGVIGKPRVRSFHAVFRARIRRGPEGRWMEGRAEQYEFFDPPKRFFFMKVRRAGLPVDVFHRYGGGSATMEGRLLGLFPILDVSGPELTRSETVTLLNDIFILAPAALIDVPIRWQALDANRVRATFSNAGYTVSAVAYFDDDGDLVDFDSRDRFEIEGDSARPGRWSTPLYEYTSFGGYRLPAGGRARWGEPGEEWAYGDFVLRSIEYNVQRGPGR